MGLKFNWKRIINSADAFCFDYAKHNDTVLIIVQRLFFFVILAKIHASGYLLHLAHTLQNMDLSCLILLFFLLLLPFGSIGNNVDNLARKPNFSCL